MHSKETKLQFIELRAQEKTLDEISAALGVCRRTLSEWNREFADDIADLREIERESLRRKLFGTTHDWMKNELDHYQRLDKELARREFKYSPTESVFRMRAESRKTIEKFLFAESPLDRPRRGSSAPSTSVKPESPLHVSAARISNAKAEMPTPSNDDATSPVEAAPATPKLAQLDPDDPNFYDESIVIEPGESARSILERYGVKRRGK